MGEVAVVSGRDTEHAHEIGRGAQDQGQGGCARKQGSQASQVQQNERRRPQEKRPPGRLRVVLPKRIRPRLGYEVSCSADGTDSSLRSPPGSGLPQITPERAALRASHHHRLGLPDGTLLAQFGPAACLARLLVILALRSSFWMPLRSSSFLNRRKANPIGSRSCTRIRKGMLAPTLSMHQKLCQWRQNRSHRVTPAVKIHSQPSGFFHFRQAQAPISPRRAPEREERRSGRQWCKRPLPPPPANRVAAPRRW